MAVLVVLCILGIVLGTVQNSARTQDHVDRVSSIVRSAIMPISTMMTSISRTTSGFVEGTISANRLVQENRRLKQMEAVYATYTEQIDSLKSTNDELRAMAGFSQVPGKIRVPASVIGFSINENRLTINVGSNQGVKAGSPVECAEGLVGTVEDVEPTRSQVLLITSAGLQPNSKGKVLGGIDVNRKPPPAGLLRGDNASTLTLTFMDPKAPVQIGDLIVTSGYSEKIPRGIVIGRVIQVEPSEEFGTLKAKIDPAFTLGRLEVVYVLG